MSYEVVRNTITKTLEEQVVGKKSEKYAGTKFFAPVIRSDTEENFLTDARWVGIGQVAASTTKNLRLIFLDIHLSNIATNEGQLNVEEAMEEWKDFTAARQSLSDIEEEIDDLVALQLSLTVDNPEWVDSGGEVGAELKERISKSATQIKSLRIKKEAIEKEYAIRAEKRKVTKAANAAKAGQQPVAATA